MNYNKLKEAIKRSRISKKDIALSAEITPKTIENILNGADPKVSTLEAITNVIGLNIGELFDIESSNVRHAGRDYYEATEKCDNSENAAVYNREVEMLNEQIAQLKEHINQLKSQIQDKDRIIELLS